MGHGLLQTFILHHPAIFLLLLLSHNATCLQRGVHRMLLAAGTCPEERVGGEQEAMWHEVLNLAGVPVSERPCPRLPPFM